MNIPTGSVTFLFSDIEGSTKLSQDFPETLQTSLERHHAIMQNVIESNNGFVFEVVGDAFCCAFQNAEDAVRAAVDVQLNLADEKWNDAVIKTRIGIHSGNAEWNGTRYMGYITLARTARVMSSGHGEQIIISETTYELTKNKFFAVNEKDITFRDLGERRMKDVVQPIRLFQILCPGLREDFPPLKTLEARPNNLPVQLTNFIGREAEMKQVKELLKQTRLLTITGSGGAGKTRLAMQVAADVIDNFANGVWFIELASLYEPDLLPQTILKVFGLKEEPNRSIENTLFDYLKDKEILIILDNCEHLVDKCAILAEKLLSISPKLKIIVTSREVLHCSGEQTHRIASLGIPNPNEKLNPENLIQYEAVRLFIERALAVNINFRVNNDNASALAQICYQLDGIPLAIELAAARIKVLSVEKIYERLNDRFKFLTGGKRTALPRQQTLRALIDWSYELLSEEEKIIWRRLSVFTGGWTLEAAEEVCSDEKIEKEEILELLNQLTEKSIIIFVFEKERYRILETLKQYGEEKLIEANEAEYVLLKHLKYFKELSQTAAPELKETEGLYWLEKLESEHSNLQSAIEFSVNSGNKEEGAKLAIAMGGFWNIRGHNSAGRKLFDRILENVSEVSKSSLRNVIEWSGRLAGNQGDFEKARKFHEESLKLSRELGDKKGITASLNNLGDALKNLGKYEQAQKLHEESLVISRESNDVKSISSSLNYLALLEYYHGNYEQAKKLYEECLDIDKEAGNEYGISISLNNLGLVALSQKNYELAQKFYEENLTLGHKMGDIVGIALSLINLGVVATNLGDYEKSQRLYEECLSMYKNMGDKKGIALTLYNLGFIEYYRGNFEQARIFYEESLTLRRETGLQLGMAESLLAISGIIIKGSKLPIAATVLGAVEASLKSMGIILQEEELKLKEKIITELREKITGEEFEKYLEEGKKLSLEQAAQLIVNQN